MMDSYSAEPSTGPSPAASQATGDSSASSHSDHRRYGPRTCRICLETVQPTFPEGITSTFGISSSKRPTYVSDDPELGRLFSPCKCRGSQKYVHEGCLQSWRLANPSAGRNYWSCPTCKFTYRMTRLTWAAFLTSKFAQSVLTLSVLFVCVFVLGFVADPILDFWFDPMGALSDTVSSVVTDIEAMDPSAYYQTATWREHFVKGFFSLGLVGFLKSMLAMSPLNLFNIRTGGYGSRRAGNGRGRMDNMTLVYVVIGAVTFLLGTWKAVNVISLRVLKNVSDRVVDVGNDDEDEEDTSNAERKDQ